jgi:hypothetical protein
VEGAWLECGRLALTRGMTNLCIDLGSSPGAGRSPVSTVSGGQRSLIIQVARTMTQASATATSM